MKTGSVVSSDMQLGIAGIASEYFAEYFRGQRRSAYSQQNNIADAAFDKWFNSGSGCR